MPLRAKAFERASPQRDELALLQSEDVAEGLLDGVAATHQLIEAHHVPITGTLPQQPEDKPG